MGRIPDLGSYDQYQWLSTGAEHCALGWSTNPPNLYLIMHMRCAAGTLVMSVNILQLACIVLFNAMYKLCVLLGCYVELLISTTL